MRQAARSKGVEVALRLDKVLVGRRSSTGDKTVVVALAQEHEFHGVLRAVIDEIGYQCYTDRIQKGTVQHLAGLRPAAIVIDVDFGHERLVWAVIQGLREHPGTADIPLVVCAAAAWLLDEHRQFLQDNHVLTWSEPFEIAELVRILDAVLNGRAAATLEQLTA
jgi:CheY-like chemotaxis protein